MTKDRLKKLEQQRARIEGKIRFEKARLRDRERRRDTRRKIVIGGMIMAHAAANPDFASEIHRLLNRAVTRPHDRDVFSDDALFPLEPLDDDEPAETGHEKDGTHGAGTVAGADEAGDQLT